MEVSVHDVGKAELITLLEAQLDRQFRVMSWLLGERVRDFRFCLTRMTQVADAQHYLWADQDAPGADPAVRDGMRRVYRAMDRGLGSLLEVLGPGTSVLVVSDCGAGPLQAGVQLNTWLELEGFQVRKAAGAAPAAAAPPTNGGGGSLRSIARRILPRPMIQAMGAMRRRLRPPPPEGPIDWNRTRAYAVGVDSGIAINLKGREAGGIVAPGAEYRAVRDALIARLEALLDPETGEPAVDKVLTAEQLYGERIAARAPDLVVEWRGSMYLPADIEDVPDTVFVSHRLKGKVLPTTGGHRPDGLLLARGPGIPVVQRPHGSVFDLVPTCLELLDVPAGTALRGKSLLH
jgi:predicted AlkP superfamily phosphohydrolase/phosphomutase